MKKPAKAKAPKSKIPYLKGRVRRRDDVTIWRFEPSPKLRKAGLNGFNLYTDGPAMTAADWANLGLKDGPAHLTHEGRPLRPIEAEQAMKELTPFIEAALKAETKDATAAAGITARQALTFEQMIADYLASAEFNRKPIKTKQEYIYGLKPAVAHFRDRKPRTITEPDIIDLYELMRERNGHSQAHHTFAYMRIAFRWARVRSRRWRAHTPVLEWGGMKIETPKPRVRVATDAEVRAIVLAADDPAAIYRECGQALPHGVRPMPSVADAFLVALWTGQRQGDVLRLRDDPIIRNEVRIRQGKSDTQNKIGKLVTIPILPPLQKRLVQIRQRKLKKGWADRSHLILTDVRGVQYQDPKGLNSTMSTYFARVRQIARLIEPSVESLNFQDTRDTAVTRLGAAGCDIWHVISWSGHSPKSAHKVIEHYMGIDPEFARRAGEKLMRSLKG
jgi:integrase